VQAVCVGGAGVGPIKRWGQEQEDEANTTYLLKREGHMETRFED
jgi:hypothetical protein